MNNELLDKIVGARKNVLQSGYNPTAIIMAEYDTRSLLVDSDMYSTSGGIMVSGMRVHQVPWATPGLILVADMKNITKDGAADPIHL